LIIFVTVLVNHGWVLNIIGWFKNNHFNGGIALLLTAWILLSIGGWWPMVPSVPIRRPSCAWWWPIMIWSQVLPMVAQLTVCLALWRSLWWNWRRMRRKAMVPLRRSSLNPIGSLGRLVRTWGSHLYGCGDGEEGNWCHCCSRKFWESLSSSERKVTNLSVDVPCNAHFDYLIIWFIWRV